MELKKNPTGIESLDPVLHGGLPSGSLVLLLGEIGAGEFEFMVTSVAKMLSKPEKDGNQIFPSKVCYISFTRGKEDILREIAFSFPEFHRVIRDHLEFKDFSDAFFARSFIPITWRSSSKTEISFESMKWGNEEENLVVALIDYLEKNAKGSVVIIDSLTVLAQQCLEGMEWKDLVLFLRGLQKASKRWDGIVYAILGGGIFEKNREEEIQDCMDGVMVFKWDEQGISQRQRIMYLRKFRGLLPVLDQDNIVNFEIQVSSQRGFEVSNVKRVRGR